MKQYQFIYIGGETATVMVRGTVADCLLVSDGVEIWHGTLVFSNSLELFEKIKGIITK